MNFPVTSNPSLHYQGETLWHKETEKIILNLEEEKGKEFKNFDEI